MGSVVEYEFSNTCGQIHTCMRMGVAVLEFAVEGFVRLISDGVLSLTTANALSHNPTWDYNIFQPEEVRHAVALARRLLVPAFLLSPILIWVFVSFKSFLARLLFLTLVFMTLLGWPIVILDGFFWLMRLFVDWPLVYFAFYQPLVYWDYGTIGFTFFLGFALARRWPLSAWQIVGLTLLGQFFFENNGIVTGGAVFLATLFLDTGLQWRARLVLAFRRLGIAALASTGLAVAFIILQMSITPEATQSELGIGNYFFRAWETFGIYNFLFLKPVIAYLLSMVSLPLFFGALQGVAGVAISKEVDANARTDFLANVSVAIAILGTIGIGFFISGLASEVGRQALPLATVFLLIGIRLPAMGFRILRPQTP